jgi:hypothetical protein
MPVANGIYFYIPQLHLLVAEDNAFIRRPRTFLYWDQFHPADRAFARPILHHLGMHGAGVVGIPGFNGGCLLFSLTGTQQQDDDDQKVFHKLIGCFDKTFAIH